jgi:hypothetical protein
MKLWIWELAYIGLDGGKEWRWLQRFVPAAWGYLGPTEESYRPRPTPWLFRD